MLKQLTYQDWYWLVAISIALAVAGLALVSWLARKWHQMSDSRFISAAELNRFSPGCFKAREPEEKV